MGQDFLRAKAARFKREIDLSKIKLTTPDLFTREPQSAARSAIAALQTGHAVELDEELNVKLHLDRLVVIRGNEMIAIFVSPSDELIEAVANSGGVACGKIRQINIFSRTIEIVVS
jgi:hypothetical protein